MPMALFLKAMVWVLLTGTPAFSRRLKPIALSQAAIVEDAQPNKVDEVGCPEGGCPDAKPEGETKKNNIVGGILKAVKGAAKAVGVAGVVELVKHHHRNNEKKKMWPTPPAEKAREVNEVQERPSSTQNQGTDPYDSAGNTTEPETPADAEEPEQAAGAPPAKPNGEPPVLKGDRVNYKGQLATVVSIDYSSHPPSYFLQKDNRDEVNTERDRFSLLPRGEGADSSAHSAAPPAQLQAVAVPTKGETQAAAQATGSRQDQAVVSMEDALEHEAQPTSPTSSEEESEVPAALTPAEEATAKWAAASPAMETEGEPAEESEESPVKEAAEQPAKDAKESFAHLSTAPLFTVFFVTAAAMQIAGAK